MPAQSAQRWRAPSVRATRRCVTDTSTQPPRAHPPDAASFTVGEADAGARLDVVLVRRAADMSRAKARKLTEEGKIRINGHRARKGAVVALGDVVALAELAQPTDFDALPDPALPLRLLYEDAQLVVVDKDAGVPSHPLRPGELGTVANALVARFFEMTGVGYRKREPGLVHRVDTDTSGVLLAARDTDTFDALREALREGAIGKRYIALVEGTLSAPVTLTYPLATHPRDARKVLACVDDRDAVRLHARDAITHILEAEPIGAFTRLLIDAPVAGRHQIRAHLAAAGHPLVGDLLYGGPALDGLSRHFLHAAELTLKHPRTRKPLTVKAPLPRELEQALHKAAHPA
jgi:23S rRNA pseudouridine1911/1915/1917 synthase